MRTLAPLILIALSACAVAPDDLAPPEIPVDHRTYRTGDRREVTIVSVASGPVCETMAEALCYERADRCDVTDVDACIAELAAECMACTGECQIEAPNEEGWYALWEACFRGLNDVSCGDLAERDDGFPIECVMLVPRWLRV